MRRRCAHAVFALLVFARPAWGQPVDPRGVRAAAVAAFEAAVRAWRAEDYPAAVEGFARAQSLVPHPSTLHNLARAEQRAGMLAESIRDFEAFLASDPPEAVASDVRSAIASMRARIAPPPVEPPPPPPPVRPAVVVPAPAPAPAPLMPAPPRNPPPEPTLSDRIAGRRQGRPVSFRLGLVTGFAAPRDRQNFAIGAEGTMFLGRSFTLLVHWLSVQTDGTPGVFTGETGWTFAGGDFDFALLVHAGVVYNCAASCRAATLGTSDTVVIGGVTLKVDVFFHPRVSFGLFGRFSWQNLDLPNGDALLSSLGLSVSFHL